MLGLGSGINRWSAAESAAIAARSGGYLLDTYSGAAAAYSLRQLSSSYSGNAIKVRRASDNAEADIRLVNGELDTTGLANHCGSSDGFVSVWYDQSSNSNDASQSTASRQPKIYDGTTGVVTENGKPAVSFDNTDDQFPLSSNFAPASDFSVILVAENTTDNADYVVSGGAGNLFIPQTTTAFRIRLNYTFHNFTISSIAQGNQMIAFANRASNTLTLSTNGSVSSNSFTTSGTFYLSNISYGGSNGYSGLFQELIMYESDQSSNRTNIEDNVNTFYSIY